MSAASFANSIRDALVRLAHPLTDEQRAVWDSEAEREADQPERDEAFDAKVLEEVGSDCVVCGRTRQKKHISATTQLSGSINSGPSLHSLLYQQWSGYHLPGMVTVGAICLDGNCMKEAEQIVSTVYNERVHAAALKRRNARKATRRAAGATRVCPTSVVKNAYKRQRFLPLRRR